MIKNLFKFKLIIITIFILTSIFCNYIYLNKAYGAVGDTFKKMNAKYHMKQIPLNTLYSLDPNLAQYDTKNSGIKAYTYIVNNVKYKAIFNYTGVCWEQFAIAGYSTVIPLESMIKSNLYGYPMLFKVLKNRPFVYQKLRFGSSIGKVIYIIQYSYTNNLILEEAIMPSMSPDGYINDNE